jgi:hypothetical protein
MRRHVLLCAVLVIAAAAPFIGTAAAAQEQVTLDVQVINQEGLPVGGAMVEATWDGGSTTGTTTSSGRTLVDVPRGEEVELQVSGETYTRNFPKRIQDAQEQRVTIGVSRKGSAVLTLSEGSDAPVQNATIFSVTASVWSSVDRRTPRVGSARAPSSVVTTPSSTGRRATSATRPPCP